MNSLYFISYILSFFTHSYFGVLILIMIIYLIADRIFLGFITDGIIKIILQSKRIKILKKELVLNPDNYADLMELGTIYYQKKNYKAALENLLKAKRKIDDSAELYLYIGISYIELKQLDDGYKYLMKAVGLNKKAGYGLPYLYLIKYELSSGIIKEEKLKKLEEEMANFSNTENSYRLGVLFRSKGYKGKAKEMFKNALSEYSFCQRKLKRLHRKWAFLAGITKSPVLSALIAGGITAVLAVLITFFIQANEKKPIDFNNFNPDTLVNISLSINAVDDILNAYNTYIAVTRDRNLFSEATIAEAAAEISGFGAYKSKEELLKNLPELNNQLKLGNIFIQKGKMLKQEFMKPEILIEPDRGRIVILSGGFYLRDFIRNGFTEYLQGINHARIRFVLRFEQGDYSRAPDLKKRGFSFSGRISDGRLIIEKIGGDLSPRSQLDLILKGAEAINQFTAIKSFPFSYTFKSESEEKYFILLYSAVTPYTVTGSGEKDIILEESMNRIIINNPDRMDILGRLIAYLRYGMDFRFN